MSARTSRLSRALAAIVAALATASLAPTAAHAVEYEQFNRADGTAGVAPIGITQNRDIAISEDGRYVYFTFDAGIPNWATASGLWRRDVLENRSRLIASGGSIAITGLSDDGQYLGFLTRARLSPADTNTYIDLYRYATATGAIELASRADGANGAVATIGEAFLTRNGRAALFYTADGVQRRDLVTGRTTLLGPGRLGARQNDPRAASADGTVVASGGSLITPSGTVKLLDLDDVTTVGTISVDRSGEWALASSSTLTSPPVNSAFVYQVSTGQRRTVPLAAGDTVYGLTPQDEALIATAARTYDVINLATGQRRPAGNAFVDRYATRNGKYSIASTVAAQNTVAMLVAADGASIPGGTDLPSANAYVSFIRGCAAGFLVSGRPSSVGAVFGTRFVPLAKSVNLKAYLPNGTFVGERTYTATGIGGVAAVGTGAWKLVATITLVDGRVIRETQDMAAIGSTNYCQVSF